MVCPNRQVKVSLFETHMTNKTNTKQLQPTTLYICEFQFGFPLFWLQAYRGLSQTTVRVSLFETNNIWLVVGYHLDETILMLRPKPLQT